MWAVRLLRRASLSPSFKSISDLTMLCGPKRSVSQQIDPAFFEISNFLLVSAERGHFLVVHLGWHSGNACEWGAVKGAPSEVLNARMLDGGEVPARLSSALSSPCTNEQTGNEARLTCITQFAHLWSRTFNQQSWNNSFNSDQFTETCALLFFRGKISNPWSPSIMLAKESH